MTPAAQRLLEFEAEAWRDLTGPEYDAAVAARFESLGVDADATAALAGAILGRPGHELVEAPAAAAERLLELSRDPAQRARCLVLFLAAWLRLVATASQTPEHIDASPRLPEGAVLPTGADPAQIADPALRAEAEALARDHEAEAQRWNRGRAAVVHLRSLASAARGHGPELALAMALAPGLPEEARREL
jgi:hypothetical protein